LPPVDPSTEVVCPGCGGSFRLQETQATTAAESRLLGRFQVLEQVGMGSFGAVWRARDPELDRLVALKMLHPGLVNSPADRERFYREARAAAQLRHPGIVTVHEVATLDGTPAIVSDFIDGATLLEFLKVRRLTFRESADLLAQVAEAVEYAHSLGLVHRDLKPANIMIELAPGVGPDGPTAAGGVRPLVLDFGLALREEAEVTMTVEGQILGTPAYMSPEQAAGHGHRVDRRSDVYSLGVILYELLCGELPFRGSKGMLRLQVLHEEPRPPRRVNEKIPRDLETICLKAMAKEPGRRYGTARELADELRRFLRGEPIRARPLGAWERGLRLARRRPAAAALTLLTGLFAATLLVVLAVSNTWIAAKQAQTERAFEALKGEEGKTREALEGQTLARNELERSLERERHDAYFQSIALAERLWLANSVAAAERVLGECKPGLRRWEWRYVRSLCRAKFPTPQGHNGRWALGTAFSPDGTRLASGGLDNTVMVWDAATGRRLHVLRHPSWVKCVAFTPDGRRLASGSGYYHTSAQAGMGYSATGLFIPPEKRDRPGELKVWDADTGHEVWAVQLPQSVQGLAFDSEGKYLAVGLGEEVKKPGEVHVLDAATGQLRFTLAGHTAAVRCLAFSPDGKRLASAGDDQTIKVWDWGRARASPPRAGEAAPEIVTLRGHGGRVNSLTFAGDGGAIVSACEDRVVRMWDVSAGRLVQTWRVNDHSVQCVTSSPTRRVVAWDGEDNIIRAWDLQADEEAFALRGHAGSILSLAFSPDGRRLVSAGGDGTIRLWDATRPPEARLLRDASLFVSALDFRPGGENPRAIGRLLVASHSPLPGDPTKAGVRLWDLETGRVASPFPWETGNLRCLVFSPDRRHLATAGLEPVVAVWDAAGKDKLRTLQAPGDAVLSLAFSQAGRRIAAGTVTAGRKGAGPKGAVRVWEVSTGKEVLTVQEMPSPVVRLAFSPDGRRLALPMIDPRALDQSGEVKVWDLENGPGPAGAPLTLRWPAGAIVGVAFSPDGTRLAGASLDGTVPLWDVGTGAVVRTLRGHTNPVICVAYSPDGSRLASAGGDRVVKLWDPATGHEALTLRGRNAVFLVVAFSPDGRQLAAAGSEKPGGGPAEVWVWDAPPVEGEPGN
jgi:WD40 repeat protein/tRNA A-37 threonylcarbamoyl transferase component Bud32